MERLITALAAVGTLGLAAAPALARAGRRRAWTSVNAQQARIDARIDRGVRDGSLTRREAAKLRGEFRDIQRLEARYRRTMRPHRSPRRLRPDRPLLQGLNAQVLAQRNDGQDRRGHHGRG